MALTILPNAGQNLLVTRDSIKNNFQTIQNAFVVNHGDYGSANQGKHLFVTLPYQTTSPATAAGEMALYTQGGVLYLQAQSQAAGAQGTIIGGTGLQGAGWVQLPSGLKLLWGGTLTQAGNYGYINYTGVAGGNPVGFPGFTQNPYTIQLTAQAIEQAAPAGLTTVIITQPAAPTLTTTQASFIMYGTNGNLLTPATYLTAKWLIIGV